MAGQTGFEELRNVNLEGATITEHLTDKNAVGRINSSEVCSDGCLRINWRLQDNGDLSMTLSAKSWQCERTANAFLLTRIASDIHPSEAGFFYALRYTIVMP
ncbi:MAG: hypothetical protein ABIA47_03895 [bacterium]